MTATSAVRVLPFAIRTSPKLRARRLLEDLRSDDHERALAAEERFRVLAGYDSLPRGRLIAWRDDLRLRHALAVIAAEDRLTCLR